MDSDDTNSVLEPKTARSSILKPSKRRLPLQDLNIGSTLDHDNSEIRGRRVSFTGKNIIKEFNKEAESVVLCGTVTYEEEFTLSDASENNSGTFDKRCKRIAKNSVHIFKRSTQPVDDTMDETLLEGNNKLQKSFSLIEKVEGDEVSGNSFLEETACVENVIEEFVVESENIKESTCYTQNETSKLFSSYDDGEVITDYGVVIKRPPTPSESITESHFKDLPMSFQVRSKVDSGFDILDINSHKIDNTFAMPELIETNKEAALSKSSQMELINENRENVDPSLAMSLDDGQEISEEEDDKMEECVSIMNEIEPCFVNHLQKSHNIIPENCEKSNTKYNVKSVGTQTESNIIPFSAEKCLNIPEEDEEVIQHQIDLCMTSIGLTFWTSTEWRASFFKDSLMISLEVPFEKISENTMVQKAGLITRPVSKDPLFQYCSMKLVNEIQIGSKECKTIKDWHFFILDLRTFEEKVHTFYKSFLKLSIFFPYKILDDQYFFTMTHLLLPMKFEVVISLKNWMHTIEKESITVNFEFGKIDLGVVRHLLTATYHVTKDMYSFAQGLKRLMENMYQENKPV